MSFRKYHLLFALTLVPALALAQGYDDPLIPDGPGDAVPGAVPGGIIPDDDTVGPVAETGAEYKFDDGLYQKIQDLMAQAPMEGEYGVYDGVRFYDVLLIVTRDDGDDRDHDEVARENKEYLVSRLKEAGALNIRAAESLSFVTASVPVADVPGLSLHDEIYALGDGELPVTLDADTARKTIRATSDDLISAIGSVPTGEGVLVSIIDGGLNSTYINDRIVGRNYCVGDCTISANGTIIGNSTARFMPPVELSHGTSLAEIMGGSGAPANNGIAPGISFLDASFRYEHQWSYGISYLSAFAHALDWSYRSGADVVNISLGIATCNPKRVQAVNLLVDEAVDKGMVIVGSAGNQGRHKESSVYSSVRSPSCGYNVISVGSISDRDPKKISMWSFSSKGPISSKDPRLVPHLVAPGDRLHTQTPPTDIAT